jgi:alpha-D-xyloside xylohydrolase
MIARLRAQGAELHLWLCPWVVVGTDSHRMAQAKGYLIADAAGRPLTRRPGANPNIVAALIDFSNPTAAHWWADGLRALLAMGVAGFKADFGEQLPEAAVLHSGETGGRAHNAFVRHYLQATIDAFDGRNPAIISRSGAPAIRTQIWTGDQTSDFCPKTGLPAAIRAVQSASLSGWPFIGSDLGGYFGTPTPQVFARWAQFAAFCPLMLLHGLGCREPWDMDAGSAAVFADCARMHLALGPEFERLGRDASAGGSPILRMMPLAFPEIDWRGRNDWDQQFMLGEDLLVAPVAFYGNTRAVWLPDGAWFDVLAGDWAIGPGLVVHDVPLDRMPLFVREGAALLLRPDARGDTVTLRATRTPPVPEAGWQAVLGGGGEPADQLGPPGADLLRRWFGAALAWTAPAHRR